MTALWITYTCQKCKLYPKLRIGLAKKYSRINFIDFPGQVYLSIVEVEKWKPSTKIEMVIDALLNLINEPDTHAPLRADIAEEYTNNREEFLKNAEEFTRNYSEPRPPLIIKQ